MFKLFYTPWEKYFHKKHSDVKKMIWDLEFKKFKTLEIREEVRLERDGILSRIDLIAKQIKKDDESEENKKLIEQRDALADKANRYLQQLKNMDIEVHGSGPCEEYPDGVNGINQQLDSLNELALMIKEYIQNK